MTGKLNPIQEIIVAHYDGGEFSDVKSIADSEYSGDTLFTFCLREADDVTFKPEFARRLQTAVDQLVSLQREFEL